MNSRSNHWIEQRIEQRIEQMNAAVLMITIVFIITAIFFLGCSSFQIKESMRIPLAGNQPSKGVSKTMDYILDYQIVYQQTKADGTGKIKFSGKVTPNRDLSSLRINLNFIDAEGKILGSKWIYPTGSGLGVAKATLQETFDTPPGTVAIAFTHFAQQRPSR